MASLLEDRRLVLRFPPPFVMSPDQFFDFCHINPDLNLELTARGEVVVGPAGWKSAERSAEVVGQLRNWARADGTGTVAGSEGGVQLPSGAVRAPDAAWVSRKRIESVQPELLERFLPLCPDFVVEVRSPTDRLADQQEKMLEYLANGALLGWLIDPVSRQVHVYAPGAEPVVLDDPKTVPGEPVLPGFQLDMAPVW